MLIVNVKDTGIFLLRGDKISHLQHPDHVMEWVGVGVMYQDKKELSKHIFQAYTGWDPHANVGTPEVRGLIGGLEEFPEITDPAEEYNQLLTKVRAGIDQMKQEYYDMMLSEPSDS